MTIAQVPRRFVRHEWGGTETVIVETCKRLLRRGHQTQILCPNALAENNCEILDGVPVRRVPYFYPYWGLGREARRQLDQKGGNLFSFSLLKALKDQPDLDLIHLHTAKRTGGIGRYVARKRGIPYVVSLHGGLFDVPSGEAQSWTSPTKGTLEWGKALGWWVGSRRVLDDAAGIICVGGQEHRQVQRRYPQKKVVHLPNGVDADRFEKGDGSAFRKAYDIPAQAVVALTVGRIDPQKNQLFLVRCLPQLLKSIPRLHLVLIGHVTNDAYCEQVMKEVAARGLNAHVTAIRGLDASSQMLVDAYHAADVFVLPSVHEPFGIVILEAWAAGAPVLASRVGGVPSFVVDGRDGVLFDPNDEAAFCRALCAMAQDGKWRDGLGRAGQAKARAHYTWETVTDRLVTFYEDVLRDRAVCQ